MKLNGLRTSNGWLTNNGLLTSNGWLTKNGLRTSNGLLTGITCFLMVVSLFPLTALSVENPPADRGDGVLENDGDWVIEVGEDFDFSDETIIINGNISVYGTLNLTRCHLIMNASSSGITVHGDLELHETNISGNGVYYDFIIFGGLQSTDSHFSEIAGEGSAPYAGGLQLYSENVDIKGGSIHHCEQVGMFINTNVTIRDIIVEFNANNVIVNHSAPVFIDCIMRKPGGSNFMLYNDADPVFIGGETSNYRFMDEESGSSWTWGHRLSVHVTYENGNSIPGAIVMAVSKDSLATGQGVTDDTGWVRDMVLPQETVYAAGGGDTVYSPYLVSATMFGLTVMESAQLESDVEVQLVLTGDYFGEAITRGDFNGDGLPDLAVGVPRNASGTTNPGAVFIYLNDGALELRDLDESMADLIIPGVEGTDFGAVLASGDVNGDGYDELFLSTPSSSENGEGSGRVYFFFGEEDPAWDSTNDALLFFKGEPGANYGRQILCGDINGDAYDDFVIGDNGNSYVFFGCEDPVDDFTSVSEFTSKATAKGAGDSTTQSVTLTRNDDDDRYELNPQEEMHLINFTSQNIKGEPVEITLRFQFVTDQYYGYYEQERGFVYYSIDGDNWRETVRPMAPNNNWDEETTLTFDLLADGVASLKDLKKIQIRYKNEEGTQGNDHYILVDYVQIYVRAIPSGANHTLPAGNLSIGDVNGDGYTDLLVSDTVQQAVYFGGPAGISAPELIEIEAHEGTASNILTRDDVMTISETRPYLNGQFDDGWNGWIQTANTEGQEDNGVRWSIVEEQNGDWWAHQGATGGFGTDQNTLGGGGNSGRNCRGMLRTADFLITDDMETIHFWYHFKAQSFEQAGGQQGPVADQMKYALYSAENNTVLMELAGWVPSESQNNEEQDGVVDANITGLRREEVYFGFEIITNYGNSDRAIAQIDNLTINPPSDVPYYANGTFESGWFTFDRNLTSITPTWTQTLNNGTISLKFRFNETENWSSITDSINGVNQDATVPSDRLQYRVEMTGDTLQTPILSGLTMGYLLTGEMSPLYLGTGHGLVKLGDIDGDGASDLLFLDEGATRGQGIDIHMGSADVLEDYNVSAIMDFYDGSVEVFSFLDLEGDGAEEVAVAGDSILLLDSGAVTLWELGSPGHRIIGDVASDPEFELNTGAIYFLPAHDHDLRILNIDLPNLVKPDTIRSFNVSMGNLGVGEIVNLTLFINITADGYSQSFSEGVDLPSMGTATYPFLWPVPEEEGVTYTITVEAHLRDDRIPEDNDVELNVISMKHGVLITSSAPTASEHGGDELVYPIRLENIGTFQEENVSLDLDIPPGWNGAFYYISEPVDSLIVTDPVDLTFIASSPDDELNDDFTLNLSATAFTAVDWLDLTATILRPDLRIEEIVLYREDGTKTNDSIHGVAGENEEFRIKVTNSGPTYALGCTVEFSLDSDIVADWRNITLDAGETVWLPLVMRVYEGTMNVSASVDTDAEVPEMDESNNDLSMEFLIKDTQPVGDYLLTGKIVNIYGTGVKLAEVRLEWNSFSELIFTDGNGTFSFTIQSQNYTDTTRLYLNASDGVNTTNEMIILYSEDGGKYLVLTLTQYMVELTGPDTISTIGTGGNTTITVQVTNKGNTNAAFILTYSDMPAGWSMDLIGYPDGRFTLDVDVTRSLDVMITASPDPRESMGHHRYFVTLMVYSERHPDANDTFTYGLQVEPGRELLVSVVGDSSKSLVPYAQTSYLLSVENLGNVEDTLIPRVMGYALEAYSFDITYADLDIGGSIMFTLEFTMPLIATGTSVVLEVGSAEDHVTNAVITTTALDYYAVQGEIPQDLSARPGDVLSLPVDIMNSGNLFETITINPWSPRDGIIASNGSVDLDMSEETTYILPVTLPEDALSGEVIPITVTLGTGGSFSLDLTVDITVAETYGMELSLLDTKIIPGITFTTYRYEIDAVNTGNGPNTFHFRVEGTHPHYLSPPSPVQLLPGEHAIVKAMVVVPIDQTTVIDNYLVPTDGVRDFGDINLRILSYSMGLKISYTTSQDDNGYRYHVQVKNNGSRFERLQLKLNLPSVDSYNLNDARWEGSISKDVLELSPEEEETFTVIVRTPELRKYWGSDLVVNLKSDSRKTRDLPLPKPPIPILGETIEDELPITIEDTLTFTGSQSLWNIVSYLWDLGDGDTATGSTISHSYRRAGEYTVTLTVIDDNGFNASASVSFEVSNTAPVASIVTTPSNRTVEVGQPILLDGSFSQDRDGEIVLYNWDFGNFGDFYEGSSAKIEHSYDQIGEYWVTLQVTDNLGDSSNASVLVYVVPKTPVQNGGQGDPIEEVSTDVLSYVPALLMVVFLIIGVVLMVQKRSSIRYVKEKIQQQERPRGGGGGG